MHQTKILFYLLIVLFSHLGLAQSSKELNKMSYDELKTAFFADEKDVSKQKIIAKEYLNRGKGDKDVVIIAGGYYLHTYFSSDKLFFIYCDSAINVCKNFKNDKYPMLAYTRKAYKLIEKNKYNQAIDNLLLSEKYAILYDNYDYYYSTKNNIGIIKSEYLAEYNDALNLYKDCYYYYRNKRKQHEIYSDEILNITFGLADVYSSLKKTDSASYYCKIGYKESVRVKNDQMRTLFILNMGSIEWLKGNNKIAIDSINVAYNYLKKNGVLGNNLLAAYYLYGESYKGLNNTDKAIENFEKVDSIYQKTKLITPEFTDGYHYLINYYKSKGNKEKQLYYINTLMSIDSTFQINYKELSKKLHKEYDVPHLMEEKEGLIKLLKKENKMTQFVTYGLVFFSFLLLVFGIKQYSLHMQSKKQFEALMNKPIEIGKKTQVIKTENKEDIGIAEEVVQDILNHLQLFEENKGFLKVNISQTELADEMNTNTKYISKIINTYKEKSFVSYINDLRIVYCIEELKINTQWQNYTISALATEVGFNSAESFSTAFYKFAQIKPSFYIKELKKIKH